jgi:hypothetical protein
MEMGQRFMLRLTAALLIATSKKLMEAVQQNHPVETVICLPNR